VVTIGNGVWRWEIFTMANIIWRWVGSLKKSGIWKLDASLSGVWLGHTARSGICRSGIWSYGCYG
jgi:hypothetical protein